MAAMLKLGAVTLLGLGVADVAWIDLELGPRALEPGRAAVASSAPVAAPVAAPAPAQVATTPAPPPPPPPEPAPAPAPTAAPAERDAIYFESSSRRIGSTARAKLAEVAARAGARGIIHLEGHTDNRGEDAFNDELARRRADNGAAVLIKQGFDAARIVRSYVGKQGAAQVAESELWRDRRVDIWIEGGSE